MSLASGFKEDELIVIFEAARIALSDAEIFDRIAADMDIDDDEMVTVREKLTNVMDESR